MPAIAANEYHGQPNMNIELDSTGERSELPVVDHRTRGDADRVR